MRWFRQGLQTELRPMLRLAGPVVLAELGWMAMGVVDTVFVGRLGALAIGAHWGVKTVRQQALSSHSTLIPADSFAVLTLHPAALKI